MPSYTSCPTLHPLQLLVQLSDLETTGCLQVFSGSVTWLIYLEQGKLIYAWNSIDPFNRLDRHLSQITHSTSNLVNTLQLQICLLSETPLEKQFGLGTDYQAICWLVEKHYLNTTQATLLIEQLAKEVIETFLLVKHSHYRLLEQGSHQKIPIFCQLDIHQLIKQCQIQFLQYGSRELDISTNQDSSKDSDEIYQPIQLSEKVIAQDSLNVVSHLLNHFFSSSSTSVSERQYTIACINGNPK